jgi:hypothetical protein
VAPSGRYEFSVALFIRLLENILLETPPFFQGFINRLCDFSDLPV